MVSAISAGKVRRSAIAGYILITTALLLVLLVTGWGAWRDISDVRKAFIRGEIARLRSHAERTVGRIESYLAERRPRPDLAALSEVQWLRDFWRGVVPRERQRLYAALVNGNGVVVMHSDPARRQRRLGARWFEHAVPEVGEDVVETRSPALTGGQLAYDIRVPIEVNNVEIAAYHSGFDAAWLEEAVAARQEGHYRRWLIMGGLITAIVLGAGASLFRLARRTAALQQALGMARTQQLAELGRLAGALAHEVRNPLNALRLNLHAVNRFVHDEARMSPDEMAQVLRESDEEIERLETLIRSILGYARPDDARVVDVDLSQELLATVDFVGQLVERDNITLRTELPDDSIIVSMDRDRFRQLVLNLLNNAREAVNRNGEISLTLRLENGWAELRVVDSGVGIPDDRKERIFEPFYTTKDRGCGLGLALVKRFTEEAGGVITCEDNGERGTRFRVCLPIARRPGTAGKERAS